MKITRRNLLATTGGLVSGFTLGMSPIEVVANPQSPQVTRPRKIKVIVCGGHPGDPEYGCGGTVAKLTQLGHEVVLVYSNNDPAGRSEKSVRNIKGAGGLRRAGQRSCHSG